MRNVSDKSCTENQNTHFMFSNFYSKTAPIYQIMWKSILEPRSGHRWHYGARALRDGYL